MQGCHIPLCSGRAAQDPGREHDQRGEKSENADNSNAEEPKRQEEKPDERIENKSQERQGPTYEK